MKDEIIHLLENPTFQYRTIHELAEYLQIDSAAAFTRLVKMVNELEEKGVLTCSYNRYFVAKQMPRLIGTLSVNKKGYGFVTIDEEHDDIYISSENLKGAFNKDTVAIEIMTSSRGNRSEGKVVGIVKRGQSVFVGEVKRTGQQYYVLADNGTITDPIHIDKAHLHGAALGHKVAVEIRSYTPQLKGNVVRVIGHKLDPGTDILSIVYEQEAPVSFEKEVFQELGSISDTVSPRDLVGRVDLRDQVIVTIDGDDAKDLDDAISLWRTPTGNYQLGVHIADVSYYVAEGSAIDQEALTRGTSIYLVDRVIPMLPHKLSNGICSLQPHTDRLTISCFMEITPNGEVVDHDIQPTVIHSNERMTYHAVNAILNKDREYQQKYHSLVPLFFLMQELSHILRINRNARGAIDFEVKEAQVKVDKRGRPLDIAIKERGEGEKIIEDFMLLANETIAMHFKWLDVPFIYRVHENPKEAKLQQFIKIIRTMGYTIKGSLDTLYPGDLKSILDASKDTEEHTVIATLLLRCMQKAYYDPTCLGHFGLADPYYTHFTSPIRRYPDLLVHRLIRAYLFSPQLSPKRMQHYASIIPSIAQQASYTERRAITIEREVEDMKKAEYMEQFIGHVFEGIICSITNFGFFVELENTVNGLVHVDYLTDDYYFFDETNLQYIGRHTGKRFKMSDTVKVKVISASKKEKRIDFAIVGMKNNNARRKKTPVQNRKFQSKKGMRPKKKKS